MIVSLIGQIYEVNITYPQHLLDEYNDLPLLLQNSIPPGSKIQKLITTFHKKEGYVVYYSNLQQALTNSLVVEKENILILLHFITLTNFRF